MRPTTIYTITMLATPGGTIVQVLYSDWHNSPEQGDSLYSVVSEQSIPALEKLLNQASSGQTSEQAEVVFITPASELVFQLTASRSDDFLVIHGVSSPAAVQTNNSASLAVKGIKMAFAGGSQQPKPGAINYSRTQTIAQILKQGMHSMPAKMRESEKQLRLLLETMREGVLQVNTDIKIVYANQQMCELTGYDFREMEGRNPAELFKISETDLQLLEYHHNLRSQGLASTYEIKLFRKDGDAVWVSLSAVPVLNEEGKIAGTIAIHLDITGQRRAKKQLELSEKRYRTLFQQNPLPMWVYSSETRLILDVNKAAVMHYGYTEDEFLSMTPLGLRPEEERNEFGKCITELKKGKGFACQGRHLKKSGEIIDVQITASRFNHEGSDGILVVAQDVSEQKRAETEIRKTTYALQESEARYKSLFEQSPNPVFSIDTQGTITDYNIAFRTKFRNLVSQPKTVSFLEIIGPDMQESANAFFMKVLSGDPGSYDSVVIDKHNNRRVVKITQMPIFINGSIVGAYGMIQDETDLFYTTQELQQSHRELRELTSRIQVAQEEERKYIALEIHDELGQILTALNIDVTLLTNKVTALLDEQKASELNADLEDLKTISKEAIRSVKRIVSELRPIALDEIGLPAEIVLYLKRFEARYAIETSLLMPDQQLQLSQSQAIEVYRILQEALTNVARHSEASKVAVTITQNEDQIQVKVEDNGRGIENSETLPGKSFGLIGMRERALMMGGKLHISPAQPSGTIISLQLPINQILLDQEQHKEVQKSENTLA